MNVHPYAAIFPMMSEAELADLAADIKANGLRFPIVTDATSETLIDGRNRLKECEIAGVEPHSVKLEDGQDPLAYIVSVNVKRRALTASQRAVAAALAWKQALKEGKTSSAPGPKKKSPPEVTISDPAKHFGRLFGAGENQTRMAFALDGHSVERILFGLDDLQTAHKDMKIAPWARERGRQTPPRALEGPARPCPQSEGRRDQA